MPVPVTFCWCTVCGCFVKPAPYTFVASSYTTLCVYKYSWPHQRIIPPISFYPNLTSLEPAVCVCIWASKIKHLTLARNYSLTLKPATYFTWHYRASFSPDLSSRDTSLFLMTSDIFSAIYFQALMRCSVCGWGGSLGAPVWAHIHVIRPYMEWHLAWPCGARLGVESWSAASLECQTFEVRLVKKERRVVGVWSNRPLCLKLSTDSVWEGGK